MTEIELFSAALEISTPWEIKEIVFNEDTEGKKCLHIKLGHKRGIRFEYKGEMCKIHDHVSRAWRHLNFFQYTCYMYADVPRVKTRNGEVKTVEVPWAEKGSSFTLMFEQLVLDMFGAGMSGTKCGQLMTIDSRVAFRICRRYVMNALAMQPVDKVKQAGLDETSYKKGHNYLTILTDREEKKVIGIGYGKDSKALEQSVLEMEIRGGDRASIKSVTMDMSKSYIKGAVEYLPNADIIFDRFHLSYNLNKIIDKIRRREQREFSDLVKTKYLWLNNSYNLTEEKRARVAELSSKYQDIGQAYRLKELFREVFDNAKVDSRLKWLNSWMKEAWTTGIKELQSFVSMLKDHWYGVKTYFKYLATNALSERINLKIQEIKRTAKGFRNLENYKVMIYFHLGKLNLTNPL